MTSHLTVKKKATRTAKKSGRSASAKSPKTSGAKAAKGADRLQKAIAVVKKSGAKGISALQLSEKAKIPYSAVRKLLSDSGAFRQQGEKRASRIFLA